MGNMRTNSIISDPAPFIPALSGAQKPKKRKLNDYEKIAASESDYPQIIHYLNSRIDHYKTFAPGGQRIDEIKPEELPYRWGQATTIITELEALKGTFQTIRNSFEKKDNDAEETA